MQKSHLHEKGGDKQCSAITGLTVFLNSIYIPNCILNHRKYYGSFPSQIQIFIMLSKVHLLYNGSFCISAITPV